MCCVLAVGFGLLLCERDMSEILPSVHPTKKAVLLSDRPSSNDCPVLCKWFWLAIFGVASDSAYKPLPPSVLLQAFFFSSQQAHFVMIYS